MRALSWSVSLSCWFVGVIKQEGIYTGGEYNTRSGVYTTGAMLRDLCELETSMITRKQLLLRTV